MRLRTRLLVALAAFLAPACGTDTENPFAQFTLTRSPSEDAVLFYVSGAWASEPGQGRELFAVNADGSEVERLTTCSAEAQNCDFLAVAPSANRDRIAAVRGSLSGDPDAAALYFMDLSRSVETVIALAARVQDCDWAFDDRFLAYSDGAVEDLFTVLPTGDEQAPLTETPERRERYPRLNLQVTDAAFEGLEQTPGKSRIFSLFGGEDGTPLALTEGGPGTEVLEGTPYVVGSDSTPAFSPNGGFVVFCRLTGAGNGGLGTWDILYVPSDASAEPTLVIGGGDVFRGEPDWAVDGRIVFVETDMASGESRLVTILPDGTGRQVIHVEDAGYRMGSPRWLR
jgi:Tol biopolymer transport system component